MKTGLTYKIDHVSDILKIPVARRNEFVKDMLLLFALCDAEKQGTKDFAIDWTDDGILSFELDPS